MKKVFVVGYAKNYADFINDAKLVNNIKDADIVLFTGGEDVTPSMYGEEALPCTYFNEKRDIEEKAVFDKCTDNQLVIGICRGSQLLCVLNGGKLVQDVENHCLGYTHEIIDAPMCTKVYSITSTHHQMQYPFDLPNSDYDLLFVSRNHRSNYYKGGGIVEEYIVYNGEPEIVLYHKANLPKCLAIQGHPEYMRKDAPVVGMLNDLINDLLNEIKNK